MGRPFVNRIEEMDHLRAALKNDGKENPVLIFTGIGGMGKTALRVAFEEHFLIPKKIPYAGLDFDGDPNLRPIDAMLRAIRRQIGRYKVQTPVFDFLYARYFELSSGVKISPNNFPLELEGVINILESIPLVGNYTQVLHGLSQLGLATKDRLKHKEWLYRIRDLEPPEILNLLPEVMAEDLEEAMANQGSQIPNGGDYRIVLLLDAYELISESRIDDALHRKLLLLTPHLLRAIFTRTPLPWEQKYPKKWQQKIIHIPALDTLLWDDAALLMRKKNIDNPHLQKHLYNLTDGYPLHMELCMDICAEIKENTNRAPEFCDFEGAIKAEDLTEELINRLLRQLKDNERDLIGLAAYPRWISQEILEELSSVPESVERIFKKFTKLSMFSQHADIENAYVIRKEIRNFLFEQQRKKQLWKRYHGKMAKFHNDRWQRSQAPYYLREAIYHGCYENADVTMKMFEENFYNLLNIFNYSEAEALLEAVPPETLNEIQKRKIDYARARFLATGKHSKRNLATAREIYRSLIATEKNEEVLSNYFLDIGKLLETTGKYPEALQYFKKGLNICLKRENAENALLANHLLNIGNICIVQAKYEEAREHFEKCVALFKKLYGEAHPDVAGSLNNIGLTYYDQGRYQEAIEYYQKSLAIRRNVFGKKHPEIAQCYNNIGNIFMNQRDYAQALECFEKGLNCLQDFYGENHPDIAGLYNSIGIIYGEQGNYEKSLEHFQKSLEIYSTIYGESHPLAVDPYDNIGIVCTKKGEFKKAQECFEKCIDFFSQAYGETHLRLASTYGNLGRMYRDKKNNRQAISCFRKSLSIWQKAHSKHHPLIGHLYKDLALSLWMLEEKKEALEKMRQSIDVFRQCKLWENAAENLETLAEWLEEEGKTKEAEETRAKAKEIRIEHNFQNN